MDVNGGHDKQLHNCSIKRQDLPESGLCNTSLNVVADKMQTSDCDSTETQNHGTSTNASEGSFYQNESMTVTNFTWQPEVAVSSDQPSITKDVVKDSSVTGPLQLAVQTSSPVTGLLPALQRANIVEGSTACSRDSASAKSDSVQSSDSVSRTSPCAFTSTRHQSYGNLGTSAGVAGLSSTSATLAFLPLQASGELLKQSLQATSLPAVPAVLSAAERTDLPVAGSNSVCACDSSGNSQPKMMNLGVSGTAAAIWDRRTNFFSEPPKPVSFPAVHPRMISSPSSASNTDDRLKPEAAGNGLTAGGQSNSFVANTSKSIDVEVPVCEELSKMSFAYDSKQPVRSSYVQQLPPPPTPVVQTVTVSPAMLTVEAPVSLSFQRDSGILLSRCKESPEVDISLVSPPGASPKSGGGDVGSGEQWYRSSPRSRFLPQSASQVQAPLWESGMSTVLCECADDLSIN
jgi:hypothetical protein